MSPANKRGLRYRLYHNPLLALIRRMLTSMIIAGPFLLGGVYGLAAGEFPLWGSIVLLGVGGSLMFVGLYMTFTGIVPSPDLLPGEVQYETRHPTMRPAYARILFSLPFLTSALYMWVYSESPYVYPFVVFVAGLYFFFKGVMRYMRNLHITYTVTDRRVVHMYRFMWLNTKEIPVSRIISISEARGFFEIITGRGSVVVASGIGERQVIKIEDINDPGPVAEALRASTTSASAAA